MTLSMGGRQSFITPSKSSIMLISRTSLSAPSRSALLMANTSPISKTPALMAWMSSPMPGINTTIVVSAARTMSTSDCPTPTVSTKIMSLPKASIALTASAVLCERPPKLPRVPMLRMNTPSSIARLAMRMRSPRMAPPENGLVGSMAMMPTVLPCLRYSFASLSVSVLLPAPGGPVMPST